MMAVIRYVDDRRGVVRTAYVESDTSIGHWTERVDADRSHPDRLWRSRASWYTAVSTVRCRRILLTAFVERPTSKISSPLTTLNASHIRRSHVNDRAFSVAASRTEQLTSISSDCVLTDCLPLRAEDNLIYIEFRRSLVSRQHFCTLRM